MPDPHPIAERLREGANVRMAALGIGASPPIREPRINRNHIDGPYLSALDCSICWLSPWERLLTKLSIWNAWDIERRHFPLPSAADAERHFLAQVREALKGDHNDLRKEAIILRAYRAALRARATDTPNNGGSDV